VGELSGLDARADVVGSLLHPGYLLEARERAARGEISPAELKTASVDNEGAKLETVAKSAKTLWS
jgi:methionine synthase II (cobalamin-independent)